MSFGIFWRGRTFDCEINVAWDHHISNYSKQPRGTYIRVIGMFSPRWTRDRIFDGNIRDIPAVPNEKWLTKLHRSWETSGSAIYVLLWPIFIQLVCHNDVNVRIVTLYADGDVLLIDYDSCKCKNDEGMRMIMYIILFICLVYSFWQIYIYIYASTFFCVIFLQVRLFCCCCASTFWGYKTVLAVLLLLLHFWTA